MMRCVRTARPTCTRAYSVASARPRVKRIGQPMAYSHPHLLRPGELTPGIQAKEYEQRRKTLLDQLPENSFAVSAFLSVAYLTAIAVSGWPERFMSNDIPFVSLYFAPTHVSQLCIQTKDQFLVFEWLHRTGLTHANMSPTGKSTNKSHYQLLVRPRDAGREIWDGPRAGIEGAEEHFGVTKAANSSDLEAVLHDFARGASFMFHDSLPEAMVESVKKANPNLAVGDAENRIEKMRVVKSPAEMNLMRRACAESGHAFAAAMQSTKPGLSQHQLEAIVEFHTRVRGARQLGYPPVVASGIDNNTLHYVSNDEILRDGDLILMDAGGEFDGYNADITRCWPVNGRFTPAQKRVYQAVLDVQQACIEACKPGISLNRLYGLSVRLIAQKLTAMGVLPTNKNQALDAFRRFYPHSIGHYLGMDIHDCQSVSNAEVFVPGMIVTVEPGIYIPDDPSIPEELRGIGVRIEDDILITGDGREVLTYTAPKEIDDIERIMRSPDNKYA